MSNKATSAIDFLAGLPDHKLDALEVRVFDSEGEIQVLSVYVSDCKTYLCIDVGEDN